MNLEQEKLQHELNKMLDKQREDKRKHAKSMIEQIEEQKQLDRDIKEVWE